MSEGISIVIPAYNYAHTLERAIRSVASQLQQCDELLVVDDGSTDNTADVLRTLQTQYLCLSVVSKINGGAASARNVGIDKSKCDWLVFLDADDELSQGALQRIKAHLFENVETRFVVGGHLSVEDSGRQREHLPNELPESALDRVQGYLLEKSIALSNGACVMHRSIFSIGVYPETFRNAEDIPVFAQALARFPVSVLPKPLARVHKHDDSLRHRIRFTLDGGLALVEEVFSRLPKEMGVLKKGFYLQRCLSLFRSAYTAGDREAAKRFYKLALKSDWRTIGKWSYTRKAFRLWTGRV